MKARNRNRKQTSYQTGAWVFWGVEDACPNSPEAQGLVWRVTLMVDGQELYTRWLSASLALAKQAQDAFAKSQWSRASRLIWKAINMVNEIQLDFLQCMADVTLQHCDKLGLGYSQPVAWLAQSRVEHISMKHRLRLARQAYAFVSNLLIADMSSAVVHD